MRVVIADDELLLREGLERLLTEAGMQVIGKVGNADELLRKVELTLPDVAIVDIKMPPTHTDEGIAAAEQIRTAHPGTAVLVLSHYLDSRYALRLMDHHPGGVGYLLKERVSDLALLTDALTRLRDGECVIDPTIVARLIRRPHQPSPLDELTERERELLALIAEGRSNKGICDRLYLSPKTVEGHVKHVFQKLDLDESPDDHRRVLAVLTYLRGAGSGSPGQPVSAFLVAGRAFEDANRRCRADPAPGLARVGGGETAPRRAAALARRGRGSTCTYRAPPVGRALRLARSRRLR